MINQKNIARNKLIVPKLIQYNENAKKNESLSSDSKISVKPIIKPKPLNINLLNGRNNKIMNINEDLLKQNMELYGNPYNHQIYMADNIFSK